jgi:predicted ArsR family transcriptional regulator
MDVPGQSGDALGQPTRARLFAELVRLRRPAGTEELAERLDLHPNGVRRHLERLREAGLVSRERGGGERGRPRDRWLVDPAASPGGERPAAYADLAVWLARAIPAKPSRLRELERAGREIGRELAPAAIAEPLDSFRATLAALGFRPEAEVLSGGRLRCRLGNCPYRDSVRANADAICGLHRGITAGLLDRIEPAARLAAFEPHDPERAGCLIEATGAWETSSR